MREKKLCKSLSVVLLTILTLTIFTAGCASSSKKAESGSSSNSAADMSYADKMDSSQAKGKAAQTTQAVQAQNTSAQPQVNSAIKKIIRNANASLEAKDANEAFENISSWVKQNGGYEFSRNVSVSGKYRKISAVFKILPEKLDSFLEFLEGAGKITGSNVSSNDITDQYYDTSARLENLKKGRDQLLEIQKRAVTIDETLKVQNELNRITGEIEALQGRLIMWDKLVAESTITLTIAEESDPMKPAPQVSWKFSSLGDILKTMQNGFIITANTLINVVVWLFVFIASASPVLVILVIGWFIYKRIKGKNNTGKM